jgi:hypothetical protein
LLRADTTIQKAESITRRSIMTAERVQKTWRFLAALVVAGASLFTTIPTSGCNGRLDIVLHEVTGSGGESVPWVAPLPPVDDECLPEWE